MKKQVLLYNGIGTAIASSDNSPSISLMALAVYLKKNGYSPRLLLNSCSNEEIKALALESVAAGFSVLTGNGINQSLRIAERVRRVCPDLPLVWGGYHPTLKPEQTLKNPLVDFVVRGEGEQTLVELLSALENPSDEQFGEIAGLSYKIGDRQYHNDYRTALDIKMYPLMDYSLYDHVFRKCEEIPYVSSRGCPFDCGFCCNAAFNRCHGLKFRQLPMERVIEELAAIVKMYDPDKINFLDDLFLSNQARLREFIDGYRLMGFKFEWIAYGRCDIFARLADDVLVELENINVEKLYFGVESGSERILRMVNKRIDIADVIRVAERLQGCGLNADFTFINGFPSETEEDVLKSLDLRRRIKSYLPNATVRFFIYTPLPGTAMLNDCEAFGYVEPGDLAGWGKYEFHSFRPPWASKSHAKVIRNISYASMFDTFPLEGGRPVPRNLAIRCLRASSRWHFNHGSLRFAPELGAVSCLHRHFLKIG